MQMCSVAAFSALAGNLLVASQASAATEVATMASDGRFASLLILFLPVLGWVLFNILGSLTTCYFWL
jgi:photosystem II PsbY protein